MGKARSLRTRVRSYFQKPAGEDIKSGILIAKIATFEVLITNSEIDALILEANLVKQYKPRYNVNLKDDKRFPYLKLTVNEAYPRVLVVRSVKNDKAKYYGPYTNVTAMRQTLRMIRRVFPIRTCNLMIPSSKKYKVCLEYFIKRCLGPCEAKCSHQDYRQIIDQVILFLSGKTAEVTQMLKRQMERYAQHENFEAAARTRDQLQALESIAEKQNVVEDKSINRDVISLARLKKDVSCVVLQIRQGILISRQNFHLTCSTRESDSVVLTSFLKQLYLHSPAIPDEIVLPNFIEESDLILTWLEQKKSGRVEILVPQKGRKAELLAMAQQNARLVLQELLLQRQDNRQKLPPAVETLQRDLYLTKPPRRIVAFDISNLGPTDAVGSAVCFVDGRPLKSHYRRFKIKTVAGQNDFAMMSEVVSRYFTAVREGKKDLPDLVLIDGGKGQLSAAQEALNKLDILDQEILGLAKRLDEVYLPEAAEPLMLAKMSQSLRLLQRVRNESHRFALKYHQALRGKRISASELDEIEGIGETRKIALLSSFGSVSKIRSASLQDIEEIAGLPSRLAHKVYHHFHSDE